VTAASTCASVIRRGAPGRESSDRPFIPAPCTAPSTSPPWRRSRPDAGRFPGWEALPQPAERSSNAKLLAGRSSDAAPAIPVFPCRRAPESAVVSGGLFALLPPNNDPDPG
jgi:hypothetical protein